MSKNEMQLDGSISCFPIIASKAKNEWSHFVFDYQQQFEDEKRSNFEYF